jgi:ABC-type uncharacterized transport system permease subunit
MITTGLQLTAAFYLAAGIAAWLGVLLQAERAARAAVVFLAAGALLHTGTFVAFHLELSPPPLTDLPAAVSLMAWASVVFLLAWLLVLRRARLAALVGLVAPAAFVGTFFAALAMPHAPAMDLEAVTSSWPHFHVLLASTGLSLLGVACVAGLAFLTVDRSLKHHRHVRTRWPSLEALDRVNRVALALGFLLLTLGVATGVLWVESVYGRPWTGTPHEIWSALAWAIYAVLVAIRFGSRQRGRRAAVAAIAGFAFLFFAVIGVSILA